MTTHRGSHPNTHGPSFDSSSEHSSSETRMIRTGDLIENPLTGETVTFQQTSADSNGEAVMVDVTLEPGGRAAVAHVHPSQTERFRVLDGVVGFRIGHQRLVAAAGETVLVAAGTAHTFWNAGDVRARFLCEIRPALGFERLLETMFALARDGKTDRRGVPHPLRLAAIADHHRSDIQLPIIPAPVQRFAARLGATAGWALAELGPIYSGTPRTRGHPATTDGTLTVAESQTARSAPFRTIHPEKRTGS